MKVCHVVAWFPNARNQVEALWIQRHIEALGPHCENSVLHLQVNPSTRFSLIRRSEYAFTQWVVEVPLKSWRLCEWLTSAFLIYFLIRLRFCRNADLINFHIAYPSLIHWHWIKKVFRRPVVITEHWSAYHFHFGVADASKLQPIKRIFRQGIPVIAVSNRLLADIRSFSGGTFEGYIVPNVVESSVFSFQQGRRKRRFFMASHWKAPKRPLIVLEAFKLFLTDYPDFELLIGGAGPDANKIQRWIGDNDLASQIRFLGTLRPEEMASQFQSCLALLHCSDYETFSVVCAEALCCGTPVVASGVGGIFDLVDSVNGLLVEKNSVETWLAALITFMGKCHSFDSYYISQRAIELFSKKQVGRRYYQVLRNILKPDGEVHQMSRQ